MRIAQSIKWIHFVCGQIAKVTLITNPFDVICRRGNKNKSLNTKVFKVHNLVKITYVCVCRQPNREPFHTHTHMSVINVLYN